MMDDGGRKRGVGARISRAWPIVYETMPARGGKQRYLLGSTLPSARVTVEESSTR